MSGAHNEVGIISLKQDSLDDLMAAIRLEVRSNVCPSWRRRHFPSDVEPLTEWEGAKGAVSMVDILEGGGGDTVLATTNILER